MFTLRSSHHAIAVDKLSDWMICLSGALLETMVPFPCKVAILGQLHTSSLFHYNVFINVGRRSRQNVRELKNTFIGNLQDRFAGKLVFLIVM